MNGYVSVINTKRKFQDTTKMIHVRHLVTGELSILVYGNTDGLKKKKKKKNYCCYPNDKERC